MRISLGVRLDQCSPIPYLARVQSARQCHTSSLRNRHYLTKAKLRDGAPDSEPQTAPPPPPLATLDVLAHPSRNQFWAGNAYLLAVSILWGSYTPALRAIFNQPGAPSPLLVAASRGVLQAALLGSAVAVGAYIARKRDPTAPQAPQKDSGTMWLGLPPAVAGAIEIGLYNTTGTILQTWGLSLSSATRAAFLVQATALWTPLLAAAFGSPPTPLLWVSSLIALVATILVTFDQAGASAILHGGSFSLDSFLAGASLGDLATLGAALAYSLSTVRLPTYASRVPPLQLAFGKSLALALTSATVLALEIIRESAAGGVSVSSTLSAFWPGCCVQPAVWALIIWSAVGPGAVSAYLHVKGQSMVGPTDAQVVFSTVPLWSALLAAAVLPGETMGPLAWAGGAGMLMAGLVAALDQASGEKSSSGSGDGSGGGAKAEAKKTD